MTLEPGILMVDDCDIWVFLWIERTKNDFYDINFYAWRSDKFDRPTKFDSYLTIDLSYHPCIVTWIGGEIVG